MCYYYIVISNYALAGEGIVFASSIFKTKKELEQSGNISKVNEDYEVKLTTCAPEDFDGIFDEYLVELERYGVKKIIAEREAYFKN